MTETSGMTLRWPALAAGVVALLIAGAGGTYLIMRGGNRPAPSPSASAPQAPASSTPAAAPPASDGPMTDVAVTLPAESAARAGIETVAAVAGAGASTLQIAGTVEPNAYKQVVVTPLIPGRVIRVAVELGDRVRAGQTLAEIFSPELAEAQTGFLAATAELQVHERELDRTTRLAAIGAASQQELERLHAEHAAKQAGVQSLRSRLVLLGMPNAAIDALSPGKEVAAATRIAAPITGVVTERAANAGLNVDTATRLFTVVDLSSVWVVGALYEQDFSRVRVGTPASVSTSAYPGVALKGRVSYIDPQVSAETRTARVRVEVPNPRQELRLGMYADISVEAESSAQAILIPRAAVQNVSDRQVVYIAGPGAAGAFTEREVRLGAVTGDRVEVLSGVRAGDRVVSKGSFFVRAERERLGLRSVPQTQTAKVSIGEKGFEPSRLTLRAGVPARVTFLRTTDKTCATAVAFPALDIRRELPLNQPVEIEFMPHAGTLEFVCGMNMLRGSIVVQ